MPFKSKQNQVLGFIRKIKLKIKQKMNLRLIENNIYKSNLIFEKVDATHILLKWHIDTYYHKIIRNPRIHCLGIRVYDITSSNSENTSTCIMKEIDVNKKQSEYLYKFPLDTGKFLIELGYRTNNGQWSIICSSKINLGLRDLDDKFFDDSWFYLSKTKINMPRSLHEKLYRLSKSFRRGGSEMIQN